MVLDKLGNALRDTLRKIAGRGYVDKELLDELTKEIQKALLQSDVNVKLVFNLTESIKKRALNEKPPAGMTEKEHVINVVYNELVKFLGEKEASVPLKACTIMLVGLFGSGKTTTAGKLANFYKKKGLKPCLIACDTFRPAAHEQLVQLGKQLGVPVFGNPKEKNSSKVLRDALKQVDKYDIKIVDSSGRNALEKEMIDEIKSLESIAKPDEILLVIPADLGQQAQPQAAAFKEALKISGVIITKMEGTAKGGGALTACAVTNAPVKFIGVGEKIDALERFDPERFVSRLIGFGDLKSLIEKAQETGAEDTAKKIASGEFTLNEFYEQIAQMKKMGPLSQIAEMIPGLGGMLGNKIPKETLDLQGAKMDKFKHVMDSMTPEEKKNPDVISAPRIARIAKGPGTKEEDVRELLKMFNQSKKVMKMFTGKKSKQMKQLMKQYGLSGMEM